MQTVTEIQDRLLTVFALPLLRVCMVCFIPNQDPLLLVSLDVSSMGLFPISTKRRSNGKAVSELRREGISGFKTSSSDMSDSNNCLSS